MPLHRHISHTTRLVRTLLGLLATVAVTACTIPQAAPTLNAVTADLKDDPSIRLVSVDMEIAQTVSAQAKVPAAAFFPDNEASPGAIGPGDLLEISVIESSVGGLFSAVSDGSVGAAGARVTQLPPISVNARGEILFPYLDVMKVAGLNENELARLIANQLSSRTPSPNVIVTRVDNNSNAVVVLGDVSSPTTINLTPARETLLQAIAAAGGVATSAGETDAIVRLTRAGGTRSVRYSELIANPVRDIHLRRGDRVTVAAERETYAVLGASGAQQTKSIPSGGITLIEALGGASGLNDNQADAEGVLVLRHERNEILRKIGVAPVAGDNTTPTVYQFDLKRISGSFAANTFAIMPGDLILITNAQSVQFRKLVQVFAGASNIASTATNLSGL